MKVVLFVWSFGCVFVKVVVFVFVCLFVWGECLFICSLLFVWLAVCLFVLFVCEGRLFCFVCEGCFFGWLVVCPLSEVK